jgi:hypothetical protein
MTPDAEATYRVNLDAYDEKLCRRLSRLARDVYP